MLFTSQTLTKCNANKIPRTIQDKQICTKYILDWLKKTQQDAGMQSKYVHIPYVYILFKLKALCLWNLTFTSPLKNNLFCNSKQFCSLWHFVECLHVSVKKCWRLKCCWRCLFPLPLAPSDPKSWRNIPPGKKWQFHKQTHIWHRTHS